MERHLFEGGEQRSDAAVREVEGRQREAVVEDQHDVLRAPAGGVLAHGLHIGERDGVQRVQRAVRAGRPLALQDHLADTAQLRLTQDRRTMSAVHLIDFGARVNMCIAVIAYLHWSRLVAERA